MKKYVFIILSLLIFLTFSVDLSFGYQNEIKTLSAAVSSGMDKVGSRKRVAVADFTDQKGNITELGKFIADELASELLKSAQGFEVMERAQLKSVVGQEDFALPSPYDQNTVKRLGESARLGAVVTGTITPFSAAVRVTINVVSTYMPKVVNSKTVDIPRRGKIEELLSGVTKPSGSFDLSGKWYGDDGGIYYIRQIGNRIWWFGENHPNAPSWSNVAYGEAHGAEIRLQWADVPKGYIMNSGTLVLEILSNGRIAARHKTGGFGGSVWTR